MRRPRGESELAMLTSLYDYELDRVLDQNPQARARLHAALQRFPSPDEVSTVIGQLADGATASEPVPTRAPTRWLTIDRLVVGLGFVQSALIVVLALKL